MNDKDYIKDLFSEKLAGHEAPVRADLWQGIQSQLGNTAATAATKGLSIAGKWMIGVASSVVIAGTAVLLVPKSEPEQETVKVQVAPENQLISSEDKVPEHVVSNPESTALQQDNKPIQQAAPGNTASEPVTEPINGMVYNPVYETFRMPVPPIERQVVKPEPVIPTPVSKQEADEKETENQVSSKSVQKEKEEVKKALIGKLSNIITPNGDNDNDYLFIETQYLTDFQVTIMNDKNQVVFSSADQDFKWYGFDKYGDKVPQGNYFYYITAVDQAGTKINKYSTLQVVYH